MVIPWSGSYMIPMLKEKNKKDKKAIYTIIKERKVYNRPKKKNKNDEFWLISLADALFLKWALASRLKVVKFAFRKATKRSGSTGDNIWSILPERSCWVSLKNKRTPV